jgi:hypothetical protein
MFVPRRDHALDPAPGRLAVGGVDAVEAQPAALVNFPVEFVGLSDHRRRGYPQPGLAVRASQAGVGGEGAVVAGRPLARADANHGPERLGEVVGQLPGSARAGEARQQSAGHRARIEPTALRVAQCVLGERRGRDAAEDRIRVRERGVEAAQQRERDPSAFAARRSLYALERGGGGERAVERLGLHLRSGGQQAEVTDPALTGRAEVSECDAIEELAEEVGVVPVHLTNT